MNVVCCQVEVSGVYDELITRPEESYRLWCVVECALENSWRKRPWPTGGCCAKINKSNASFTSSCAPFFNTSGISEWYLLFYRIRIIWRDSLENYGKKCFEIFSYEFKLISFFPVYFNCINIFRSCQEIYVPPGLTFKYSTCWLHSVCEFSAQTATFALYNINSVVSITEVESVYSTVRTDSLYKADYA